MGMGRVGVGVGMRASIWFLMMPMHVSISRYTPAFSGQHGCTLARAESSMCATSAGGCCFSVQLCQQINYDVK